MNARLEVLEPTALPTFAAVPPWMAPHRVQLDGPTLDEVIGLRTAKREVVGLVSRLTYPEAILAAGAGIPRGVLFHGPAGCGKTYLARMMASMLARGPRPVEFYSLAASDLSPTRFEELTRWLSERPTVAPMVVIYVDEIDLWGRDRDDYRHTDTTRGTLLAALAAIDGLDPDAGSRALWLASSNKSPGALDDALVRAGRFGFRVAIDYPTLDERAEILRFYAATRRMDPSIDWARAAALAGARTTPAALRQALDDAFALALADHGPDAVVGWDHVAEALLRAGRVVERRPWSAQETWAVAVHEAGHAVAMVVLGLPLTSVSLRPDGGTTESDEERDVPRDSTTATVAGNEIVASLAALAAERLVVGDYRMGGHADISDVTRAAIALVNSGMTPTARPLSHTHFDQSPAARDALFFAASAIVAEGRTRAEEIVSQHRHAIELLAERLVERKHLSGGDLAAAIRYAGLVELVLVSESRGVRRSP